jgi:hypothetical protein
MFPFVDTKTMFIFLFRLANFGQAPIFKPANFGQASFFKHANFGQASFQSMPTWASFHPKPPLKGAKSPKIIRVSELPRRGTPSSLVSEIS